MELGLEGACQQALLSELVSHLLLVEVGSWKRIRKFAINNHLHSQVVLRVDLLAAS